MESIPPKAFRVHCPIHGDLDSCQHGHAAITVLAGLFTGIGFQNLQIISAGRPNVRSPDRVYIKVKMTPWRTPREARLKDVIRNHIVQDVVLCTYWHSR